VSTYAYRVGPLGGTQYDTYAVNWTYGTVTNGTVGLVYDSRGLTGVTTARPRVTEML
jgi:hypothetical protein